MNVYRQRLYTDIYETLEDRGPMTANELVTMLQPRHNMTLNSLKMAKYLEQLGGQGLIEKAGMDRNKTLYKAVTA